MKTRKDTKRKYKSANYCSTDHWRSREKKKNNEGKSDDPY